MEAKGSPYREAVVAEMDKINRSETERYLYLRREMALSDEISRIRSAERKGKTEGVKALIETCREFGESREDTLKRLTGKLSLTEKEAAKYMDAFWEEG